MTDDNDLLIDGAVTVDGCCDKLGQRFGRVRVRVGRLEVAEAAPRQVDC